MGRKARMKPERVAEKLLRIRKALDLSQLEMLQQLGFADRIDARRISEFERGDAEPPLPVLLGYARVARIPLEEIVNDKLNLPGRLPGTHRYKSVRRHKPRKRRRTQS